MFSESYHNSTCDLILKKTIKTNQALPKTKHFPPTPNINRMGLKYTNILHAMFLSHHLTDDDRKNWWLGARLLQVTGNIDMNTANLHFGIYAPKKDTHTTKKSPTRIINSQQGIHALKNANATIEVLHSQLCKSLLSIQFPGFYFVFVLTLLNSTAATYDSTMRRNL